MTEEEEALAVVRASAPRARRAARMAWGAALAWTWLTFRLTYRLQPVGRNARRAARASWGAALAWTWLAWRLTLRVWLWGVAESLGLAIGLVFYGLIGLSVVCVAALRGDGGLALDGWRWLWRRA